MKRFYISVAAIALSSTAAFAQVAVDTADTDGDGFATPEELMAAFPGMTSEEFAQIDMNGDGRIGQEEIRDPSAQELLRKYTADAGGDTGMVMDVASIDLDGDGFASSEELMAAYPQVTSEEFSEMDMNDDGRLDSEELYAQEAQQYLNKGDMGTPVVSVAALDTDGDGFVSKDELMAAYPTFDPTFFGDIDQNDDARFSEQEMQTIEAQDILKRYL